METLRQVGLVMAGGALGALSRYGFAFGAARLLGGRFPWGTLLANLTGCLLIGLAFGLSERAGLLSPSARLFFMTGFLGALTTFSTYALESVVFLREGSYGAVINFLLNNLGGGVLVLAGMWLAGFLTQRG
jgi:CrcB protein